MNLTEVVKRLEETILTLQSNKERIEKINNQMNAVNYPKDFNDEKVEKHQDNGVLDKIYLLLDCIENTAVEQRIALDVTESFL